MQTSPRLSARLNNVLNQLEKIIDELDQDPQESMPCSCDCGQDKKAL